MGDFFQTNNIKFDAKTDVIVFGYGSLMNIESAKSTLDIKDSFWGYVQGFTRRIDFNPVGKKGQKRAYAAIVPSSRSEWVSGIFIVIARSDVIKLNRREGNYRPVITTLFDVDQVPVMQDCMAYLPIVAADKASEAFGHTPEDGYVDECLKGIVESKNPIMIDNFLRANIAGKDVREYYLLERKVPVEKIMANEAPSVSRAKPRYLSKKEEEALVALVAPYKKLGETAKKTEVRKGHSVTSGGSQLELLAPASEEVESVLSPEAQKVEDEMQKLVLQRVAIRKKGDISQEDALTLLSLDEKYNELSFRYLTLRNLKKDGKVAIDSTQDFGKLEDIVVEIQDLETNLDKLLAAEDPALESNIDKLDARLSTLIDERNELEEKLNLPRTASAKYPVEVVDEEFDVLAEARELIKCRIEERAAMVASLKNGEEGSFNLAELDFEISQLQENLSLAEQLREAAPFKIGDGNSFESLIKQIKVLEDIEFNRVLTDEEASLMADLQKRLDLASPRRKIA